MKAVALSRQHDDCWRNLGGRENLRFLYQQYIGNLPKLKCNESLRKGRRLSAATALEQHEAVGSRPHSFEPRSCGEDDARGDTSPPNFHNMSS
ncbi:hypothetical protein TNCV_2982921 [Trichonephila clavipes]|nr:hypothetical protein TNCV_2982921 [Trichonephila clavipes]